MLKGKQKAPKLRANAAHCRALVPISKALAHELLDPTLPIDQAVIAGLDNLDLCYRGLSADSIFYADGLRTSSTRFAQQYVALERAHAGILQNLTKS